MKGRKDRDEDLLLFKELHKREKDRFASLLQPVSDEFEPHDGNYRINASGKQGSGYGLFGEVDKNDYNWLKTPPATPLFPSLEMEAAVNAPKLVLQREIPTVQQPLSRFATSAEAPKPSSNLRVPVRSITPSCQTPSQSADAKLINQKMALSAPYQNKPRHQKQTQRNPPAKNIADSNAKPTTTAAASITNIVSPRVVKVAQVLGFSNGTPPNLRTDRAISAIRGRPVSSSTPTLSIQQKSRRQSCSPSVTRGRKENTETTLTTQKGKFQTAGTMNIRNKGTQNLFGSRMVDKLMNARKMGASEREAKPKPLATDCSSDKEVSTNGGFGNKSI
ncbi:uncharacterized protein LOC8263443 [Ricinus communis]|uniref:Uncharacterized protein n=1 Tax=Ricinus communis TaxID=3988 RepID=B9RLZ6_RICCO|nr:uncharacterized protein LOC8263443 [Ricinus communis]EEF47319.1 conserved hypothetical protein [Ricinus communis]|eukprot:XP_002514765.1 uncharacterized protein LOC8263443 [Ricinus communis]